MSKRQQVTAVRVANVPEPEFEAAVESKERVTVTKLAPLIGPEKFSKKSTDRVSARTLGGHGRLTQGEAARRAGISEHQQLQAVRVANRWKSGCMR
jgi:hypothetical protein